MWPTITRHLARRRIDCHGRHRAGYAVAITAVFGCTAGLPAGAETTDIDSLRSQVDEAYYARDANRVEKVREALLAPGRSPADADTALYYAAYARFRQSLLAAGDKKAARRYLDGCIEDLEALVARRTDDARAHAMLASCYGTSAQYYLVRAAARGIRAGSHLDEARKLAPDDPWVILQDAISDYSRPAAFGGDKQLAQQKLERAAALFAAEHAPGATAGVWGEAEAWLYLGRLHRDAGRTSEARQALERALALAPANRDAQEELAALK
jgi:tetratricopeptide (TPR) repeat protein